jgi:type I restriction-modification system DNA methylase subunit
MDFGDKVGLMPLGDDLLRGDCEAREYSQVILPLTVLRRVGARLAPADAAVLATGTGLKGGGFADLRLAKWGPPFKC